MLTRTQTLNAIPNASLCVSQTMMRVKDATKTIAFYRDILGMDLVREGRMPRCSS